jgi:ATP-dependent DNA helicase RecG
MSPHDHVSKHFRLTPLQARALNRLGITSIESLVRHIPFRYDVAGESAQTNTLTPGAKVTLYGTFSNLKAKKLWKSRRNITEGWFEDATGKVKVMWFNQPYMASYVREGSTTKITGTVGGKPDRPYIANPEVEVIPIADLPEGTGLFTSPDQSKPEDRSLHAMYPETSGITSLWFRHAIEKVLTPDLLMQCEDPIPADIRERYNLPDLGTAFIWIHKPEKQTHAEAARKRFAFEEIFTIQVARARERAENDSLASFPITDADGLIRQFLSGVEYKPTTAQERAIDEIVTDFQKGHPMARLLEGDVGSGKTLVAAATAYAVVNSRPPKRESGTLQVAYMAPTEILAAQHFESFIQYFKHLPINIALMTGSGCKKFPSKISRDRATDISRAQLLKWVSSGEIAMLVGTHALIQKSVEFQHLAFAIVDEQHRFGTRQRRALAHKDTRQVLLRISSL